ncbi:GNAT family N-acetyltransferase [Streptomyces yaizuensis]|uniref:GNAT family N-acetyltransferase n=1 Tax=Streptomyces yaizuensis TaxID=2989713 RepID=A0ABQ5P9D1_9ACTN|nr:GNAT family N-acetyltransferase [Streptomyces sp. YSPA8]GLF99180.1 GNAT family N-acetyltransferase [Streptomyces sp. YSPA8]
MTDTHHDSRAAVLAELERYCDAVPRSGARAEDFGPLTLFVRDGGAGGPYYARPALDATGVVTADAVARVRARQRELGVPERFEWVAETTPALRAAVAGTGLAVQEYPLMVLDPAAPVPAVPERADGVSVRIVAPGDPVLPSALAVPSLAFADPGTATGPAGRAEIDAEIRHQGADGAVARTEGRMRAGLTRVAAAVDTDGVALCAGQHQPAVGVSEIVGVGTLPSARRRGLGLAVTAALAADARATGVRTVFLSAADDDVARLYARLGFRHVGTVLIGEPPE